MILEVLKIKFGKATKEINKSINGIDSEDKLNLFHRHAIKCNSLDEFKSLLDGEP